MTKIGYVSTKPDNETQNFINWIHEQPDDKPVDMLKARKHVNDDRCGCLMVQYGEHLIKGILEEYRKEYQIVNCSFHTITLLPPVHTDYIPNQQYVFNNFIDTLIPSNIWDSIKTFGHAKKVLNARGFTSTEVKDNTQ